ncbi:MAG: sigma-70 family RNA polymerase sigma factor [Acidobacteriota bacterium]|nr:sigma-70 family RNA polymerase sigma factor [Acidobacteriota bacterium]
MEDYDEARVLNRCRAGDLGAYRQIYERYEQPLLRMAWRMLGRREEAEDAVQETFLKLYRGIGGFRSGARFSTYLFRILINTCTDTLRKRRHMEYAKLDADLLPAAETAAETIAPSLVQAVDRLPGQMKTCFVLNAVEEFTLREVAEMLDLNIGSVKTSVHRARKKLRTWLAPGPAGETS